MSGPAGFLEFFILEAGDYIEQLDGILLRGGPEGPDAGALQRAARALRGAATMAKLPAFAELAASIERVGRALHDQATHWDPALGGALVAAVDDLKILLRAARGWSQGEEQRAAARTTELARYAPARTPAAARPADVPSASGAPVPSPASSYFATEAANIAAGLELLTTRAGDADTASNVLRRVRALRGVAGIKEITPLADVLEATENAARGLEANVETLSNEGRQLLEAAAAYLRGISAPLRGDGDIGAQSSARESFDTALEAWTSRDADRERVVPIAELFYSDEAPGLVEASQNPPTSVAERFRLELVSHGEHLRQVIDAARHANDAASTARARRDLRTALRALQAAARSFGASDVADLVGQHLDAAEHVDFLGLAALDDLAATLAEPGADGTRLKTRLAEIAGGRDFTNAISAGFGGPESAPLTPAAPAPLPPPSPRASAASPLRVETPAFSQVPAIAALDAASASLIDSSIAALESLTPTTFAAPTPIPEDMVVPIESLLYRGRAALDRAAELRDELKRTGSRDGNALDELFDLIELARAE